MEHASSRREKLPITNNLPAIHEMSITSANIEFVKQSLKLIGDMHICMYVNILRAVYKNSQ